MAFDGTFLAMAEKVVRQQAAKDFLAFPQKALEFRDGDGAFFFAKKFAVFFEGDAADDGSGTAEGFLELCSGSGRVKAKNPASLPGKDGGHVGNTAVAADQANVSVIHFGGVGEGAKGKLCIDYVISCESVLVKG